MQKKILVLMSTYNGEAYIKEQLDSILQQTITKDLQMDLYIRDDGSSDTTHVILEEYKQQYENITIEYGHNIGVIASFFDIIKQAKEYDYYALADQDDIWLPDKLSIGVEKISTLDMEQPALYASCSLLVENDMQGNETTQTDRRGLTFNNVIIQNLMPGHTQIFNQALADFLNAYEFDTSRIVVHDFWIALLTISFGNITFDNQYHTLYRQHHNNAVGYGHGAFGWLRVRIQRILNSAAKDITRQDLYFYELFKNKLSNKQRQDLHALLYSQRNFFTRSKFLMKTNVYRQRKFETFLFYTLYLFGGYKIKEVL